MTDEPVKKKEDILRLLADVVSEAHRVEALGQDLVGSARFTLDVVDPLRLVVSEVPPDYLPQDALARQVEALQAWRNGARNVEAALTSANSFGALSTAFGSTATGMIATVSAMPLPSLSVKAVVDDAKTKLNETLNRSGLTARAESSMCRLGLDRGAGVHRTALVLLDEARAALERPAVGEGSPASVLIPLRESINTAIAELLRRRPRQEPASKVAEKLASLGRQCARSGLGSDYFDRLGAEADLVLNELSVAKQAAMARERVKELFHRGLLLINSVLDAIDESSLRQ